MILPREVVERLDRSRTFLKESYQRPITLEEAASQAYFSPFHFHRLYSGLFRETPLEFVTRLRAEHAKKLLLESDLTVTEICLEVGYSSLGTFSSRFRDVTGCSPTEFRNETRRFFELGQLWTYKLVPHCFVRPLPLRLGE
ncbi:MAG: helix-turn-helix transcriptional regulator [Armatimonadetes bacterium]|nr:helix-turn-helix transcriptional regulator [Armatimonadota bacterium]